MPKAVRELSPFGVWLKAQVSQRNLSLAELGRRAGINSNALNDLVHGVTADFGTYLLLADALGVSRQEMLAQAGLLEQQEQGFEIPPDIRELVAAVLTLSPDGRRRTFASWRDELNLGFGVMERRAKRAQGAANR